MACQSSAADAMRSATATPPGREAGSKTPTADCDAGSRAGSIRCHRRGRSPGRRHHPQHHTPEVPRLPHSPPGTPQRAWQGRSDTLFMIPLHFAPGSTGTLTARRRSASAFKPPSGCNRSWPALPDRKFRLLASVHAFDIITEYSHVGPSSWSGGATRRIEGLRRA